MRIKDTVASLASSLSFYFYFFKKRVNLGEDPSSGCRFGLFSGRKRREVEATKMVGTSRVPVTAQVAMGTGREKAEGQVSTRWDGCQE